MFSSDLEKSNYQPVSVLPNLSKIIGNVLYDKGVEYVVLFTDLSKAFDCLPHDLIIAKLHAYGFDKASLRLMHSYLTGRYQRVKIDNFYSIWILTIYYDANDILVILMI